MNIEEFNALKSSNEKSVVIVGAEAWCIPCKNLFKKIHNLSPDQREKIYKVDADENFELVESLGVKSVPSVFYMGQGNALAVRDREPQDFANYLFS